MKLATVMTLVSVFGLTLAGQDANQKNLLLDEGFETVKVNNKGVVYSPYIYPTVKLKTGEEFIYIRGKREVAAGKFSLKMTNTKEQGAFFIMADKIIPACKKDEQYVLSADVRGTGYVQLALVNYTAKDKFLGTVGGTELKGKPGISKKKPLNTEEWTTIYFRCPRHSKTPDDGKCKLAIFAYAKSEVYIDNIKIWTEKK
ncbi:MAG: hypothetical protein IKB16_03030 [Lentisphaeria bacterium]|nr:hypothetical protein [Lentisphaeria bacterium]